MAIVESDVNNMLGRKPGSGDIHDQMLKTPASGPIAGRSAKKALSWMLCAQRPLKSRELIAAISVDSDGHHTSLTRNHITSICNGMVVWDSVLDEFRFTHLSVREYLELQDDYSFTKIHTLALERCLDVYLFESVTSTDSTIEQGDGNYRSIAERNEIFRNYADIYWPLHCKIVQDNLEEANLPTKLQQFLFQESTLNNGLSFSKWISAMDSSAARISRCPPLLRRQLGAMFSTSTTPFFLASAFGLTSILDYLDRNRPRAWNGQKCFFDWNQQNKNGDTGLQVAAACGQTATLKLLLEKGAHVDAKGAQISTALHKAAEHNQEDGISFLLEQGADIEAATAGGWTPLLVAIERGNEAAVFILLEKGAKLNTSTYGRGGKSPLRLAAEGGYGEIVKLLIEEGAGVDVLHAAAKSGTQHIAKLLLDQGADINLVNEEGNTPLHIAVENAQYAPTEFLLRRGADITIKDKNGKTPLDLAKSPRHERIRELFQKRPPIDGPFIDEVGMPADLLPKQPLLSIGRTVCREIRATVVDFFLGHREYHFIERPSVFDLLYGKGPEVLMQGVTDSMKEIEEATRVFRWLHLPANNVRIVLSTVSSS
jgi:ankyrin repeat protein